MMSFLKENYFLKKSKFAYEAMESVSCRLFKTPPRFPDLNPIENIFNLILENNWKKMMLLKTWNRKPMNILLGELKR